MTPRHGLAALALVVLSAPPTQAAPVSTAAVWVPTQTTSTILNHRPAVFADGTAYAPVRDLPGLRVVVYKSTDHGRTWTTMPTVAQEPVFGTATVGYHLGSAGEVFRTGNGAQSWQAATPLPPPPSGYSQIATLAVAPGGQALVAPATRPKHGPCVTQYAEQQEVFVSGDGAGSWHHHTVAVRGKVHQTVLADGSNGALWLHEVAPGPLPCAASDLPPEAHHDAFLVTGDGGQTWQRITAPSCVFRCTSMAMVAPDRIVVGDDGGNVHLSDDRGQTFQTVSVVSPTVDQVTSGVHDVAFANHDVGYVVTAGRGIWRTADGGTTWTLEGSPDHAYVPATLTIAGTTDHAVALMAGVILTRTSTGL